MSAMLTQPASPPDSSEIYFHVENHPPRLHPSHSRLVGGYQLYDAVFSTIIKEYKEGDIPFQPYQIDGIWGLAYRSLTKDTGVLPLLDQLVQTCVHALLVICSNPPI